jgi:hypothetical protein
MELPRCLTLNQTNEFLHVHPWFEALSLIHKTYIPQYIKDDPSFLELPPAFQKEKLRPKVDVLAWFDEYAYNSIGDGEFGKQRLPAVIRLNYCVRTKRKERLNGVSLRNVLVRDNWKCSYCGIPITERSGTRDHVHPLSKGGPNVIENVVASCKRCNNLKDNMSLGDFEKQFGFKLDRSRLRKLTEEEKIKSVIHSFKEVEHEVWFKCLQENHIELW